MKPVPLKLEDLKVGMTVWYYSLYNREVLYKKVISEIKNGLIRGEAEKTTTGDSLGVTTDSFDIHGPFYASDPRIDIKDAGGWIENTSKEAKPPVDPDTMVEVEYRDGRLDDGKARRWTACWKSDDNSQRDIIRYRIIKEVEKKEDGLVHFKAGEWFQVRKDGAWGPALQAYVDFSGYTSGVRHYLPKKGDRYDSRRKDCEIWCKNLCALDDHGEREASFNWYRPAAPAKDKPLDEPAWKLPDPPPGKQWHRTEGWTKEMLPEGMRPLLADEHYKAGDEYLAGSFGWMRSIYEDASNGQPALNYALNYISRFRTSRPLPEALDDIHNPENVPMDKIPDGWTLLRKIEVGTDAVRGKVKVWNCITESFHSLGFCMGNCSIFTYIIPKDDPPVSDDVKDAMALERARKLILGVDKKSKTVEIPDPYAEAKAAFMDGELEVISDGEWKAWISTTAPNYDGPPEHYRRRPKIEPCTMTSTQPTNRTIESWLSELPEPYRSQALEARASVPLPVNSHAGNLFDAICDGFDWCLTKQRSAYWANVAAAVENNIAFPPPWQEPQAEQPTKTEEQMTTQFPHIEEGFRPDLPVPKGYEPYTGPVDSRKIAAALYWDTIYGKWRTTKRIDTCHAYAVPIGSQQSSQPTQQPEQNIETTMNTTPTHQPIVGHKYSIRKANESEMSTIQVVQVANDGILVKPVKLFGRKKTHLITNYNWDSATVVPLTATTAERVTSDVPRRQRVTTVQAIWKLIKVGHFLLGAVISAKAITPWAVAAYYAVHSYLKGN